MAQVLALLRKIRGVDVEGESDGIVRLRADSRGHAEIVRVLGDQCRLEREIRHVPQ